MEAMLCVPPDRGMVRFIPVAEECLAWGSKTVAGRISEAVVGEGDDEGERSRVQERRRLKVVISYSMRGWYEMIWAVLTEEAVTLFEEIPAGQYFVFKYTTSSSFTASNRFHCLFGCSDRAYGCI